MKLALEIQPGAFLSGTFPASAGLAAIGWLVNRTAASPQYFFSRSARPYKTLNLVEQTQLGTCWMRNGTARLPARRAAGDYLDSYGKAMNPSKRTSKQLQGVVGHKPSQQTNITELQDLVTVRLGIDANKIAARNQICRHAGHLADQPGQGPPWTRSPRAV